MQYNTVQYNTYITSLSIFSRILDITAATLKENYVKFGHTRFGLKIREILAFLYVFFKKKNCNTLGNIFRSSWLEVLSC